MLCGAAVVIAIRTRRESTLVMGAGLALAGLATALLALVPVYWIGVVCAFGVGLFGNVTIISVATMLQALTANYIRGRVMGANSIASTLGNVAVNFVIWRMPNADTLVVWVMLALGPVLTGIGVACLIRALSRGPMASPSLNAVWRIVRLYTLVWHRLHWRGNGRIPAHGPVILASNHTTGLDPMLIQAACPRRVRWVMLTEYRFGALNFLWRRIEPICLDRGTAGASEIRQMLRALKQDELLGFFPEGGLQRTHRDLGAFHPGIATLAQRSGAWVVPVWIAGTPQRRNMLWHFLQPSRSRVTFGEPYRVSRDASQDAVLDDLRRRMRALA